jgi:hypothetical protein
LLVDVLEIKKLDAYLKRQFGNPRIRVVPKSADSADVMVGEERIGGLVVDDEDGERSYNFEMKLMLGEPVSIKSLKALEATLRRRFDNENIRVMARPRKTDSAEVCIGQDYIGVLFFDEKETRSCFFEMPILDFDLEETRLA